MKFLYINDVEFLLTKRKKMLIVLLFVPLIILFLNVNLEIPYSEIIGISMGTNINMQNFSILEIIMFLFNVSFYIFFIADIYIKDILYQLDNIFLRMKPVQWIIKKNYIFIVLTFTMKFIQYFLLFLALLMCKKLDFVIIKLMMTDLLYTLFIQYSALFTYVLGLVYKKMKFVFYLVYIVFIILIPKNIISYNLIQWSVIIICVILLLYFTILIFRKKNVLDSI